MKKILLGTLLTVWVCFGQTTVSIPPPPNANDSLTHPEFGDNWYCSVPAFINGIKDTATVFYTQNIGDFDGDGSDDIFTTWRIYVSLYKKDGGKLDSYSYSRYHYGIFSVAKNKYFFSAVSFNAITGNVITGDFNNDGKIDFIVGNKVYLGTATLSKKKVFP